MSKQVFYPTMVRSEISSSKQGFDPEMVRSELSPSEQGFDLRTAQNHIIWFLPYFKTILYFRKFCKTILKNFSRVSWHG